MASEHLLASLSCKGLIFFSMKFVDFVFGHIFNFDSDELGLGGRKTD